MTIELKHNQIVRGFGFSQYAKQIKIGTARGFATDCKSDPEEAHEHCLKQGHPSAWTNQAPSVLSADYAGKAEAHEKMLQQIRDSVILANNQIVTIEGEQFKVRLAGEQYSDPIHFKRL